MKIKSALMRVSSFPNLKHLSYGSFASWLTFYDSFKSMCHNNQALAPIQKFHYLKACVKGKVAEVIASLETTSQNYQVAWELLKAWYDNEKYIVESHVNALFDIPNISREFSIRALLEYVQYINGFEPWKPWANR